MLDTNATSHVVRNPAGAVAQGIAQAGPENVVISIIVAAEMLYGIERPVSVRLRRQVEHFLSTIEIVPFAAPADRIYGSIRAQLTERGIPISGNDFLIAAHAIALDATLVTANTREFERVPGLRVQNWERPGE